MLDYLSPVSHTLILQQALKLFLDAELSRQKAATVRQEVKSEPSVIVRAERQAKFVKVHEVMTVAKQVGFKNISLETK